MIISPLFKNKKGQKLKRFSSPRLLSFRVYNRQGCTLPLGPVFKEQSLNGTLESFFVSNGLWKPLYNCCDLMYLVYMDALMKNYIRVRYAHMLFSG
ncbi:hypothetical protein BTR25_20485 [Bacillus sp. MRMR6]|nr:hypothetical protein BTR25_20485 [Bacillus sp. MRMR6]